MLLWEVVFYIVTSKSFIGSGFKVYCRFVCLFILFAFYISQLIEVLCFVGCFFWRMRIGGKWYS